MEKSMHNFSLLILMRKIPGVEKKKKKSNLLQCWNSKMNTQKCIFKHLYELEVKEYIAMHLEL